MCLNIFIKIKKREQLLLNLGMSLLLRGTFFIFPTISLAAPGDEIADPLNRVLDILSGAPGVTLFVLAIAGAGYKFYRGQWAIKELLAAVIGSGLVFGAVTLGDYILN